MTKQYEADIAPLGNQPGRTTGLDKIGPDINASNEYGMPPIHVAFYVGAVGEAAKIFQRGADPASVTVQGEISIRLQDFIDYHSAEGRTGVAQELNSLLVAQCGVAETLAATREEARERLTARGFMSSKAPEPRMR